MFLDYAQRTLIEGFELSRNFATILSTTSISCIARHTSIAHFRLGPNSITIKEYIWSHEDFCPWGHRLPPACPSCHSPRPYGKSIKQETTLIFVCGYSNCRGRLRFDKPDGVVFGNRDGGGKWLIKEQMMEFK